VPRYLFVPLAESVIFAMLASYVLSRTLVPTLAMYLLKPAREGVAPSRNPLVRAQRAFERGFEQVRGGYRDLLASLVEHRRLFIPIFLGVCLLAFLLAPHLGRNFFPDTDSGQISLHMRAKTGTRIEETARIADLVEAAIRREIPASELDVILDNIGLPYSTINWIHSSSDVIGDLGRRHPGLAEGEPPAHRGPHPEAPRGAAAGVLGQVPGGPAAAERLDQQHAGV